MSNKKISALTSATTPLAGTEVLPIVQGGVTKQVSIANLTAGRTVDVGSLSSAGAVKLANGQQLQWNTSGGTPAAILKLNASNNVEFGDSQSSSQAMVLSNGTLTITNGNLVQGAAAKGVNFTANTPAAGMTSQLLNWYEEGTWTPTLVGGTTAGSYTVTATGAMYTRVGRQVTVTARMAITVNSSGTGTAKFGGLPFPKGASQYMAGSVYSSNVTYGAGVISVGVQAWTSGASSDFAIAGIKSGAAPYDVSITDITSTSVVIINLTYFV